jgi:hypothetical protein
MPAIGAIQRQPADSLIVAAWAGRVKLPKLTTRSASELQSYAARATLRGSTSDSMRAST